jgi:hypothetical protein
MMAIEDRYADTGFQNAAANAAKPATKVTNATNTGAFSELPVKTKTSPVITTPDDIGFGLAAKKAVKPIGSTGTTEPTGPTGPTNGLSPNESLNGNQLLVNGKPFGGMKNGILFINGYRQDQYNPDGTERTPESGTEGSQQDDKLRAEELRRQGQSAYDILLSEFTRYGLQALVEPLKGLITSGASSAEFSLALQNTDAYKKRFAANQERINKGLAALSPAEYITLEDQYQNVMRNYGLPASYYTKDAMGTQQGFEKFLAADVSATELEDRIMTAQTRVINANSEVTKALKQFYPDITNGDILAYALNPQQGLSDIKRKVTAAEIGGAAMIPRDAMGNQILTTSQARAEQLAGYGVDKAQATQGFATIGAGLQRGSQLASIYGEDPYTQTTAEAEVFNVPGAQEARKQRQKITGLERAAFGGQTGITQGTLARDRAGAY